MSTTRRQHFVPLDKANAGFITFLIGAPGAINVWAAITEWSESVLHQLIHGAVGLALLSLAWAVARPVLADIRGTRRVICVEVSA